jgi:hypothetical protein
MIDQDKMRALAKRLHGIGGTHMRIIDEAADAIDLLLAEVEGLRAARIAYANEFAPDAEGLPDTGNIHANIRKLKAELEAAAADKRRLDFLDSLNARLNEHYGTTFGWKLILSPNIVRLLSGNHRRGYVGDIDLNDANYGLASFDSCRKAIDAALAQRQGEES